MSQGKFNIRRIAFYLWINVSETDIPYTHEYVHRICNVVIEAAPELTPEYAEVISRVLNEVDIVELFYKILQDRKLVGEKLSDVLYMLIWIGTQHHPARSILGSPSTQGRRIVLAVAEAFQRHLCLGNVGECPKDEMFRATIETL